MRNFFLHHQRIKTSEARIALRWVQKNLPIAQRNLSKLLVMPILHRSLWMCIHRTEATEAGDWHNQDTGHNGHYGGLQMHPDWGYGTSYYASNNSAEQQMRAAERGYRASGYSRSWLMGQWYHPECLRYA